MKCAGKAVFRAFAVSSLVFTLFTSVISFAPSAEATDAIPQAARLIGAGGNVYSQDANTPASCKGGTRGITSDGTYIYYRSSGSSSVICKTTLTGVFVSANTVTGLDGYSSEQRALTYANGCILFRNSYVAGSGIMCVDTSSWTLYGPFAPSGGSIPLGGGWLSSNIMNFPDGRVGSVSAPNAGVGTGPACPITSPATYCKYLRLYDVSRTGNSLSFTFDSDITLADTETGWPGDDHGMATDGTYLYQIRHDNGYKVWKLNSGTPSTIIFNGDGATSPCGATTGTTNTFCPIYAPINGSNSRLMNNATYFGRSHLTNQYIMGDYGSGLAQFWISASVAPPPGIGSEVTAPVLSAQSASSVTQTGVTLNFTSDEAGTYYYLIYGSASSAPDTATIISQGSSPPTIVKGTSSATASANTVAVTGLSNGTSYKAYVVVQDSSGNTSLVSTITFTTVVAAPAFTLSSSSETRTYLTSGTAFTTNSTGGLIASFAISATPAGMSFDTSTGTLSGAPTTIAASTTYTVTATNVTGTATQNFALTVTARPITIKAVNKTVTYNGSAASVTNSHTITSGTLAGSDTFTVTTHTYSSASYSASETAPANAGSYIITPSAASFSVGSASNYTITYDTAILTINKASQSALSITSTSGSFGTPLTLATSGGSGDGLVSYVYEAGTTTCTLSSGVLTAAATGTCLITATKATDDNYSAISSSQTTITFAAGSTTATITIAEGSLVFRQAKLISASASVVGKVTFRVNNKILPGCKNKSTTGSAPNIIATCSYRPSTRGFVTITVTLNPTDPSYIGTVRTSDTYFVNNRSGARGG